jgi:uncharacterized protein
MSDFYVYCYIDPRNFEEFYYGKGKGSRKDAHLQDSSDSAKSQRISDITNEGLVPIIRVLARGLTEDQALLVEKTLLWKLGKFTTNVSTGAFAQKFRPVNTLHKELSGFDFRNGIYYYNVGEGAHRNWDDYVAFEFISAGQGPRWRDAMLGFNVGDVFAAYLKGHGFVGAGRIVASAKKAREVKIGSVPLLDMPLMCKGLADNADDDLKAEYVCKVKWLKALPRDQALWQSKPRLFTSQLVRASLDGQVETVKFLERELRVSLRDEAT